MLKEIKKQNKRLARRVLQCLVVAVRPLRVEELAEVLAVDFDDAQELPRLKPDWRWEDQELALMSTCSSLIAIVEADSKAEFDDGDSHDDSRVVQFSHYSVKEFLTSRRLANAGGEVSNYHIDLEPAHTVLAQACLSVLLQPQGGIDRHTHRVHSARYAAAHWATHAQSGKVSSSLHKGMEHLFDANKSHFKAWLTLCDIDTCPQDSATFYYMTPSYKFPAAPLYYAALCGFNDLVEHLIINHPQDVNADGGYYVRPLVAALAGEHFQTADLLRHNGADLHVLGKYGSNLLHAAAHSGNFEVVRKLIEYDPADIHAVDEGGSTPLHWASKCHDIKGGSVLRLLLEHGADINVQNRIGRTPLHWAAFDESLDAVRLLLEHGADVGAKDDYGKTVMQEAGEGRRDKVVELLREYGAK